MPLGLGVDFCFVSLALLENSFSCNWSDIIVLLSRANITEFSGSKLFLIAASTSVDSSDE